MRRITQAVVLAGTVALAPMAAHTAGAQVQRGFTAFAEATVFNVQYGVPGFILTDKFADQGGTTAQARYESAGARRGNAQIPYLGFAADYPGLIATGGGPEGLPAYPGRALADDATTPEQIVGSEGAPYFLKATVSDTAVQSLARLGFQPGGEGASPPAQVAQTSIVNEGDTLTVTAETTAQGLSLGPLVVRHMASKSVTTYTDGTDKPVTTSELIVQGVSSGGQAFNIGPEGEGLSDLNKAIAPSGVEVNFASARSIDGGVAGAGLEFVQTHATPGAGQGQGVLRVRFGGVVAAIDLGTSEGDSSGDGVTAASRQPAPSPPAVIRRKESEQ